MINIMRRKYKVDLEEISKIAVERAFGETRFKVNEDGLSEKALEAKKGVIAIQETGRLFVKHALAWLQSEKDKEEKRENRKIEIEERHRIEEIGMKAIAAGGDCIDYLEQFCE